MHKAGEAPKSTAGFCEADVVKADADRQASGIAGFKRYQSIQPQKEKLRPSSPSDRSSADGGGLGALFRTGGLVDPRGAPGAPVASLEPVGAERVLHGGVGEHQVALQHVQSQRVHPELLVQRKGVDLEAGNVGQRAGDLLRQTGGRVSCRGEQRQKQNLVFGPAKQLVRFCSAVFCSCRTQNRSSGWVLV